MKTRRSVCTEHSVHWVFARVELGGAMSGLSLVAFNAAPASAIEPELLACCSSDRWVREVLAGRPYPDLAALRGASDAALAKVDWPDIERALTAHPRIGERTDGAGQAGAQHADRQAARESAWSRREQAAAATADTRVRADLLAGNQAYEQWFGHIFLICASGLPAEQVLAALRARLGNDRSTERAVVRDELRKISQLRLTRLVAG